MLECSQDASTNARAFTKAGIYFPAFYPTICKVRIQHPIANSILKSMTPGEQTRLEINVYLSDLIKIHEAALLQVSSIVALENTVGEDHQEHMFLPAAFSDSSANGDDQEDDSEPEEHDREYTYWVI